MIETPRLILRPWRDTDRAPFAVISQDMRVMTWLVRALDRAESDAWIALMAGHQARLGHCLWAMEHRDDGALIGVCGLKPGADGTPISASVEIGWRLRADDWGRGYAREAAQASLSWAWHNLPIDHVHAITAAANIRSRHLMEKLGMERCPNMDFDHPIVPEGHELKPHVAYVAQRP